MLESNRLKQLFQTRFIAITYLQIVVSNNFQIKTQKEFFLSEGLFFSAFFEWFVFFVRNFSDGFDTARPRRYQRQSQLTGSYQRPQLTVRKIAIHSWKQYPLSFIPGFFFLSVSTVSKFTISTSTSSRLSVTLAIDINIRRKCHV